MGRHAVDAFTDELNILIDRFRAEWDLTYAEAIGCIELVKVDLLEERNDRDE